jgi:2-octaprenyl-6-methoxyphenol hydroxylase
VAGYDEISLHLAGRAARELDAAVDTAPPAHLVVHAEGHPGPGAIEKDYRHAAIVSVVEVDRPVPGAAWERFTGEGPLALLPLGKAYGVVWSRTAAAAARTMDANDEQFIGMLQAAFGMRMGCFLTVGPRASMPLALRYSAVRAQPGELRIGNAAQTLHPVAGQGLNLGLRDAWALARILRDTPAGTLGSAGVAQRYAQARRADVQATIRTTDLLATLYVRRDPFAAMLRSAALGALDIFPPARKAFARRMIYGASAW